MPSSKSPRAKNVVFVSTIFPDRISFPMISAAAVLAILLLTELDADCPGDTDELSVRGDAFVVRDGSFEGNGDDLLSPKRHDLASVVLVAELRRVHPKASAE